MSVLVLDVALGADFADLLQINIVLPLDVTAEHFAVDKLADGDGDLGHRRRSLLHPDAVLDRVVPRDVKHARNHGK